MQNTSCTKGIGAKVLIHVLVLIYMKYFFINCSVLTQSDNIVMNMKQIVKAPLINVHVYEILLFIIKT